MIKAITFDFWNTLYRTRIPTNNERIHIIEEVLVGQGHRVKTKNIENAVINITLPGDLVEETAVKIGHAVLSGISEPAAGSVETIKRLSKEYKLGVISDTGVSPSYVLKELLKRAGIIEYFKALVFSDEFGKSKPDCSVFMQALELLDVEPKEAVQVGDLKRTDMEGAGAAGMYSIRYAGIYDDTNSGFCEANVVVNDFSELEYAVKKLAIKP